MKTKKQIELNSKEEHKACLLWLLENYPMASKFDFVAKCYYKATNIKGGYKKIWEPTKEGVIIYEHSQV